MKPSVSRKPLWLLLAAILCAAGGWTYLNRLLIPHQISDASAHDHPRGNLSDLYPRWLGARELLLHHRDPYSGAVTREIQLGYYGRVLDPRRAGDPKDQQAFAYPVYVVFYLAPTVRLPFSVVRAGFLWLLLTLTVAAVPLWLRIFRWSLPLWAQASLVALTLGSLQVLQALVLQQMTLLVFALLTVAIALLVSHRPIPAGITLALATIKPQLVFPLLLCLLLWTLADWRSRFPWALSFLITLAFLLAASELWLPHWFPRFIDALREYRNYTDSASVLDKLAPPPGGWILRILAITAAVFLFWKNRRIPETAPSFTLIISMALAVTVIVIPNYHLYNQILLLPGLILLARLRQALWNRNPIARLLLILTAALLFWPWLASIVLVCLSFILPFPLLERAVMAPAWSILPLPLGVAALILLLSASESPRPPFPTPSTPTPS